MNLQVTCLRFTAEATTQLRFAPHAGAQLRGGIYNILRHTMHAPGTHTDHPSHLASCPVCRLMRYEDPSADRGKDRPRPFGILPPQPYTTGKTLEPGHTFTFGVHLYGDYAENYRLLSTAIHHLGAEGVGYGRGRFHLRQIDNIHPFTGEQERLFSTDVPHATLPTLVVTQQDVVAAAGRLSANSLKLRFLTPLRLIHQRKLIKSLSFAPFILRLVERLEALEIEYADGDSWKERYLDAKARADAVELGYHDLQWRELITGSRRTNTSTYISGLMGEATFRGQLDAFRNDILWGSLVQVGKDVVKGNGWYDILN